MESRSSSSTSEVLVQSRLNVVLFSNELPGEESRKLFRRLHQFSKDKRFRVLASFLDECKFVIEDEAHKLPSAQADVILPFSTVFALADTDITDSAVREPVNAALLSVLELALIIGYHECEGKELQMSQLSTVTTGLSIGMLQAAALSIATSLEDLAKIGCESVRLAFRCGSRIESFSRLFGDSCPEGATPTAWDHVVLGLSAAEVQKEIDVYNKTSENTSLTRIYVSAKDGDSVKVTGPPARLSEIFKLSKVLSKAKYFPLTVYQGLCHGSHLFSEEDIRMILDPFSARTNLRKAVNLPILSSSTGKRFGAKFGDELYHDVITEIMTTAVELDQLNSAILERAVSSSVTEVRVALFRHSLVSTRFEQLLNAELKEVSVSWQNLTEWSTKTFEPRIPRSMRESKLAIVGMSCRLPGGADDNELFWKLLLDGRDTHTTVPADRFDLATHYDPTGNTPNATQTPFGNFISQPGLFDPAFFNMSPREAEQTDPAQRLALVTAYEALEMSGYVPGRTPSSNLARVGTYYGQASDDWRELNATQNIGTYIVTGGVRAFGNGRINYFFNFEGPSINIDTACSSGLAAVDAACAALWAGQADTVLAGGLNIITDPDNYCGLSLAHFLSKTGQCKVWDKTADGYCRSDGIGSVVIKRLEDAVADNDNILATILSSATNHSANAVSITHPHAGNQSSNYRQVMRGAGVDPLDVGYIELHGTGTQAGDATESKSVTDVFAPLAPRRRPEQKLLLGSVKSNIGHGEAAAGIASFIKVLLMYQKNHIPPHVGIVTEINPTIPQDLEQRNVALNLTNNPWSKVDGKTRYSIVNSFGAHGGNTTVLLEDPPEKIKEGEDNRSLHPITISAKSKVSLKKNIEAILGYLAENPDVDIGDLSYTTCARRIHHPLRIATSTSSLAQLSKFLATELHKVDELKPIPIEEAKVVFAFTGQGSYYKGISSQLYMDFPYYREQVRQLDYLVKGLGFPSVLPVIDGSSTDDASPVITQLSIVVVEIALAKLWALFGLRSRAVIGHSLGEYAAFVAAGVLSAADALYLVGKRATLLSQKCQLNSHVMMAVRASHEEIKRTVPAHERFEVSCINGREDTVISGKRTSIDAARKALEKIGARCTVLDLPYAFHTEQMDPLLDEFQAIAGHVLFSPPTVPVLSPYLGTTVVDGGIINAEYVSRATRSPVNFVAALDAAWSSKQVDEKSIWVELGPHPLNSSFIRNYNASATTLSSLRRNEDNYATLSTTLTTLHLRGLPVSWKQYFRPVERAHDLLLLPSYKWNEKNYWIQYHGTWTLDKAFAKDGGRKDSPHGALPVTGSSLRTPWVHQVVQEDVTSTGGKFAAVSDLLHPDFLHAIDGHRMNGYGVAATCIWMDAALSVGRYLYKRMKKSSKDPIMNLIGMEVHHPQVASLDRSVSQLIQLEADADMASGTVKLNWYNVAKDGSRSESNFGSTTISYEDPASWKVEWDRVAHLVNDRIESLARMATEGIANKLNRSMAYTLFRNCVEYADEFHGMQTVVMKDFEAYADVTLVPQEQPNCHTPPHWIDSVVHLAGFICNASDASNTKDFFYVTPQMGSYRVSKTLEAGGKYQSYVRMFPTSEANVYVGDVYILENGIVIGMVDQIKFQGLNRALLDYFFTPPDKDQARGKPHGASQAKHAPAKAAPAQPKLVEKPAKVESTKVPVAAPAAPAPVETKKSSGAAEKAEGIVGEVLEMIANETGIDISDLTDDRAFSEIGVDSLMSLVLSEKFRKVLGIDVRSSTFIEYQFIGELKEFLQQYC